MKKTIKAIIWIVVLGGLGYLAYTKLEANKNKLETEAKLSEKRNTIIPVITAKVGTATWAGNFEVVGNFSPNKQVAVVSEAAGKVVSLKIKNGDFVKRGATLLSVDNDLLDIQLQTVSTNLLKAENDYSRLKNLLGDGGVTQQQIDDAKLGIDNLRLQIEALEKQISMTYVTAPISGIISNKKIEKGSLVSPSMPIANITDISVLKLQIYLTEEQVVNIKKGDKVKIQIDIFPEKKLEGRVSFIDINAGPSRRYLIEIDVKNNNRAIKAGMTATAYFAGGEKKEVLAVPRESIVGNLQNAKIYVVENDKAILKNIRTGAIIGDMVQVKNGLDLNETIVTSGQINLEDGMAISYN